MPDTRQLITERLRSLVDGSRLDGGVISTTAVAKILLSDFPDCKIPSTELESMVALEATRKGVAISFDGTR